jgi:hypothetical protein
VTQGAPARWTRSAASGRTLACHFCAECGARLWHESSDPALPISVKAGSLDRPVDTAGAVRIWVKRKLPGIVIPDDAPRFDEEPD